MVVLCYDGSADAKSAIDSTGVLLKSSPVVVLSVWEPFIGVMTRAGLAMNYGALALDAEEVDAASERGAAALAEEGAARARDVRLDAQPRTTPRDGSVPGAILDVADEVDAEAIVLGSPQPDGRQVAAARERSRTRCFSTPTVRSSSCPRPR